MLPFRESLAAVFFVSLGLLFQPLVLRSEPWLMLGAFVALIVTKACAATIALWLTGLRWRESAGVGIGLAHVGEFAFVLVLMGADSGVIDTVAYQRVIVLAIGSLLVTPILLKAGLRWTDTTSSHESHGHARVRQNDGRHMIVIGAGPVGVRATTHLEEQGHDVCVIDFSPVNLNDFAQRGTRTVAGDASDMDILTIADTKNAELVVVAVPNDDTAIQTVMSVRKLNATCFILVRCRYQANVDRLRKVGADSVVSEEVQAGSALVCELRKIRFA